MYNQYCMATCKAYCVLHGFIVLVATAYMYQPSQRKNKEYLTTTTKHCTTMFVHVHVGRAGLETHPPMFLGDLTLSSLPWVYASNIEDALGCHHQDPVDPINAVCVCVCSIIITTVCTHVCAAIQYTCV